MDIAAIYPNHIYTLDVRASHEDGNDENVVAHRHFWLQVASQASPSPGLLDDQLSP